jgi:hypothetical protein
MKVMTFAEVAQQTPNLIKSYSPSQHTTNFLPRRFPDTAKESVVDVTSAVIAVEEVVRIPEMSVGLDNSSLLQR